MKEEETEEERREQALDGDQCEGSLWLVGEEKMEQSISDH